MINWSKLDCRNDVLERLRAAVHVPHEHFDGQNECHICDANLCECVADKLEQLKELADAADRWEQSGNDSDLKALVEFLRHYRAKKEAA